MRKRFTSLLLATAVILGAAYSAQAFAEQRYFKPESGGYRLSIPAGAQEIYHTTTGIRFVVGKNQLVSADIYSMPNFISVPVEKYSQEQKKDLAAFIQKTLDFSDFKFLPQSVKPTPLIKNSTGSGAQVQVNPQGSLKSRLEALRSVDKPTTTTAPAKTDKDTKPTTADIQIGNNADLSFAMQAPQESTLHRKYLAGRGYQLLNDKMLIITVASPEAEKNIAQAGLAAVTNDLKPTKPRYPEYNIITSGLLGMEIELPAGWHGYTLKADNIIFARSLSSVHEDNAMVRSFKTNEFADFAQADANSLKDAENNFVDKITKYTPNISIVKHEPVIIDGLNGSIIQFTDSDDLKKVFVVNTYLFTKDGIGYQIRFNTDDTINYDLKMQAFTGAIKSFRRINTIATNTKIQSQAKQKPVNRLQELQKARRMSQQATNANQTSAAQVVNKERQQSKK